MSKTNDPDQRGPIETRAPELTDREWKAEVEALRTHLIRAAGRSMGPALTAKVSASDLVQETFLAARQCEAEFRGRSLAEWRGWLRAILRNRVANARRSFYDAEKRLIAREVPLGPSDASGFGARPSDVSLTSPSENAMRGERALALRTAVDQLPNHYRAVVLWHHEEQLTFDQIADRLDISSEAARKVWGRALVKLKDALGSAYDPR